MESPTPLIGAGIDAERPSRFVRIAAQGRRWDRVWSQKEWDYALGRDDPALGLCAAFCCKEALYKALGGPYLFPECELRYRPERDDQELDLAPALLGRHTIGSAAARVSGLRLAERGELLATVLLFARHEDSGPIDAAFEVHQALESLALARLNEERDAIAASECAPEEIAAVAGRRIQTLAGFIAAKRALAALHKTIGVGAAARAADFILAHDASGAPRLLAGPAFPKGSALAISIAHTSAWAYGIAAATRFVARS